MIKINITSKETYNLDPPNMKCWEGRSIISILLFVKNAEPQPIYKKTSKKLKLRDILQNNWQHSFQKSRLGKKRLRNSPILEGTKETWQVDALWYFHVQQLVLIYTIVVMNMMNHRWGIKKKKTKMENSGQHGRKVCISFNITRKKYLGEIILEVAWKIESQMTYWGGHERLLTQNKELGFLTKTKHSDERAAEGCWWRKRTQKQYNSIIQK